MAVNVYKTKWWRWFWVCGD